MNLKTIAEKAGVSTATVSNVINGNYHKVSEETRKRVEAIIRETDYQPSVMARALSKKATKTIGLIIPYVGADEDFMINAYYAYVIGAVEQLARSRGYYLMLRCTTEAKEILPLLEAWQLDGAIFLGVFEKEAREIVRKFSAPAVFIDTYTEDDKIVSVGIDDYRGGYLSARYLISKGHRRLALVSPQTGEGVIRERYMGFSDACRESGIDFGEEDVFLSDALFQTASNIGQDIVLSGRGYTAIATMSDQVAMQMMVGIRQCGVRIPEDISIIGFDNVPEGAYAYPRLTTVEQDYRTKAMVAGEYLIRMIEGDRQVTAHEKLPVRIKERDSVHAL